MFNYLFLKDNKLSWNIDGKRREDGEKNKFLNMLPILRLYAILRLKKKKKPHTQKKLKAKCKL